MDCIINIFLLKILIHSTCKRAQPAFFSPVEVLGTDWSAYVVDRTGLLLFKENELQTPGCRKCRGERTEKEIQQPEFYRMGTMEGGESLKGKVPGLICSQIFTFCKRTKKTKLLNLMIAGSCLNAIVSLALAGTICVPLSSSRTFCHLHFNRMISSLLLIPYHHLLRNSFPATPLCLSFGNIWSCIIQANIRETGLYIQVIYSTGKRLVQNPVWGRESQISQWFMRFRV